MEAEVTRILESEFGCRPWQATELVDKWGWTAQDLEPWRAFLAEITAKGVITRPAAYVFAIMGKQRHPPDTRAAKPKEPAQKPVPPVLERARTLAEQGAWVMVDGKPWKFDRLGLVGEKGLALYSEIMGDLAGLCERAEVLPEVLRKPIPWETYFMAENWTGRAEAWEEIHGKPAEFFRRMAQKQAARQVPPVTELTAGLGDITW